MYIKKKTPFPFLGLFIILKHFMKEISENNKSISYVTGNYNITTNFQYY